MQVVSSIAHFGAIVHIHLSVAFEVQVGVRSWNTNEEGDVK